MERIPYFGRTLTRWRIGNSTFLALPEQGALLMNWALTLGDGTVRDVIYWPELAEAPAELHRVRGGNPILFPFPGRTFDRGEIHFWRDPAGERRPMPMHGIARQGAFRASLERNGFTAQLLPGDEARAAYPFDYEFKVIYRFDSLGLTCELSLANLGAAPIPWSPGHHFYFTLPWTEGARRGDYLIRIPAARTLRQDFAKGGLVPGPALKEQESMANPDLVDAFHTQLRHNEAMFGEAGRPGDVSVVLGSQRIPSPEAGFVTWTADDKAPFYCVEPWMGPPNPLENRLGLRWVQPGMTDTFTVEVRVKG